MTTTYFAEQAWLSPEGGTVHDVTIEVSGATITSVTTGSTPAEGAVKLPGFVMPGLVNCHSHVFHRALRGRTHQGRGDFWSWREQMYSVLSGMSARAYSDLAAATYAEMTLSGITTVVEFQYLARERGGSATSTDVSVMDRAVIDAAERAGIHLVLANACYLQADVHGSALSSTQEQFSDGSVSAFLARMDRLRDAESGPEDSAVAIHSVRGCPPPAMRAIAKWAHENDSALHIHLSEQVKENLDCIGAYGCTPAQLCADTGVLGDKTTAIHATHLDGDDIALLGGSGTIAGFCPTTERDLADGIGPARALRDAGSPLALGSDSHAIIDLFEEARAVELNERLATQKRGHHSAAELLTAATVGGAASAGLTHRIGRIAAGYDADFIAVDMNSTRTAGATDPVAATVFSATNADVTDVVRKGRRVVANRRHDELNEVGLRLAEAVHNVHA